MDSPTLLEEDIIDNIPLVRHEKLYFDDGNVVLGVTTKEPSKLLFRLHKSILSKHSPIFKTMFTLDPETGSGNPVYDGVPFVEMPDKADDLVVFLLALYDPTHLPYKKYDPRTPIRVRGILALTQKYEAESVRSRIVEHIQSDWPTCLEEWDRFTHYKQGILQQYITEDDEAYEDVTSFDDIRGVCADEMIPEPVSAICLARDFDIPSILPAAFYELSLIPVENDWDTFRDDPSKFGHLLDGERTARWNKLRRKDTLRLLAGSQAKMYIEMFFGLNVKHGKCREVLRQEIASIPTHATTDPLDFLDRERSSASAYVQAGMCEDCTEGVEEAIEKARRDLWEDLPKMFHLVDE